MLIEKIQQDFKIIDTITELAEFIVYNESVFKNYIQHGDIYCRAIRSLWSDLCIHGKEHDIFFLSTDTNYADCSLHYNDNDELEILNFSCRKQHMYINQHGNSDVRFDVDECYKDLKMFDINDELLFQYSTIYSEDELRSRLACSYIMSKHIMNRVVVKVKIKHLNDIQKFISCIKEEL